MLNKQKFITFASQLKGEKMTKVELTKVRGQKWRQVHKMIDHYHRLPPNLQRQYDEMIQELLEEIKELSRRIWQISG